MALVLPRRWPAKLARHPPDLNLVTVARSSGVRCTGRSEKGLPYAIDSRWRKTIPSRRAHGQISNDSLSNAAVV
jgi:hypothetical protein